MSAVAGWFKVIPQRIYYAVLSPSLEYCCELGEVNRRRRLGSQSPAGRNNQWTAGGAAVGVLQGRVCEGLTPKPFREESPWKPEDSDTRS